MKIIYLSVIFVLLILSCSKTPVIENVDVSELYKLEVEGKLARGHFDGTVYNGTYYLIAEIVIKISTYSNGQIVWEREYSESWGDRGYLPNSSFRVKIFDVYTYENFDSYKCEIITATGVKQH